MGSKKRARKARSYNTRKFKNYPRTAQTARAKPSYSDESSFPTIEKTADLRYCPIHGRPLSESSTCYWRVVEDVVDGQWTRVKWTVRRRYCADCRCIHTATPEGVLPKEHFGVTVMSRAFCLRCMAIPYEKMGRVFRVMLGRFIDVSPLQHMCDTVADRCRPLYEDLLGSLKDAGLLAGDDTGWYLNGKQWWVWAFITSHTVAFHLSASRSKMVTKTLLDGFEGITLSDSHSSWNDIGTEWQKCLLHYFRDLYRTQAVNKGEEFKTYSDELHSILKDAIQLWGDNGHVSSQVPLQVTPEFAQIWARTGVDSRGT